MNILYKVSRKRKDLSIVILLSLPSFTKVPSSLATPVQGTTFQVTCQAEGYPRPAVNWIRAV